jgi:hypothetical protein
MEKVQIRSGILKFFGPLVFTRPRSGFGFRLVEPRLGETLPARYA